MAEIIERLRQLRIAVDVIISECKPEQFPGAINWGDLGCRGAYLGVNDDNGICYLVVVDEVAPGEEKLCLHIARQLQQRGWNDVEVITEW